MLLFLGAGIVTAFQIGKAPPVLPAIRAELGMSLFAAGWILSAFSIIGLVFGSIIGAVSDAFGHRRMLLIGLASQATGSLIGAFSHLPLLLISTRTLEGVGSLMIAVAAPSLIIHLTQPRTCASPSPSGAAGCLLGQPLSCCLSRFLPPPSAGGDCGS